MLKRKAGRPGVEERKKEEKNGEMKGGSVHLSNKRKGRDHGDSPPS